jgi:hypothetical protein
MNRFHSKYHRQNHSTYTSVTNPDAGSDPIASYDNPFLGDFVLQGGLSAIVPSNSAYGAVFFGASGQGIVGINTATPNVELTVYGSISASNTIFVNSLAFTASSTHIPSGSIIGSVLALDSNNNTIGYIPIYQN